jgi:hypothetical protein
MNCFDVALLRLYSTRVSGDAYLISGDVYCLIQSISYSVSQSSEVRF